MDPSNHIQVVVTAGTSGSTPPSWNDAGSTTPDGTVTWKDSGNVVVSQTQRIAYLSNAVAYIHQQYPNVKVMLRTSNGTDQNWTKITGNCGASGANACPALMALPLWDVEYKKFTGGDGNQHWGDGVAGLVPWKPWSSTAWQTRSGNQYDWKLCTAAAAAAATAAAQNPDPEALPAATPKCGNETFFGLSAVNLDYFDPTLFK